MRYKRCSECKGRINPDARGPLAMTCSEDCATERKNRRQALRRLRRNLVNFVERGERGKR